MWVAHGFKVAVTYASVMQCITHLDKTAQTLQSPLNTVVREAETSLHVSFRDKSGRFGRSTDWLCAPNTVDLSGPEWK